MGWSLAQYLRGDTAFAIPVSFDCLEENDFGFC